MSDFFIESFEKEAQRKEKNWFKRHPALTGTAISAAFGAAMIPFFRRYIKSPAFAKQVEERLGGLASKEETKALILRMKPILEKTFYSYPILYGGVGAATGGLVSKARRWNR